MRKQVMAAAILATLAPAAMAQSDAPAPAAAPAYDAAAAKAAVATLADELEKNFVFPDTAKRYAAALRTKLAAGGYDGLTDGYALATAVTADLQAIAPTVTSRCSLPAARSRNASANPRPSSRSAALRCLRPRWSRPG